MIHLTPESMKSVVESVLTAAEELFGTAVLVDIPPGGSDIVTSELVIHTTRQNSLVAGQHVSWLSLNVRSGLTTNV